MRGISALFQTARSHIRRSATLPARNRTARPFEALGKMAPTTTMSKTQTKSGAAAKATATPFTPLQQRWTILYTTTLPKLAATADGKWPVNLDHCFARIILDNAVGIDKPWTQVVAAPATRNMSQAQLKACVSLGDRIASGEADLWELDELSLKLRGKTPKSRRLGTSGNKKRKLDAATAAAVAAGSEKEASAGLDSNLSPKSKKTRKQEAAENWSAFSMLKSQSTHNTIAISAAAKDGEGDELIIAEEEAETLPDVRHIISSSADLTPFRRNALLLLTQVPRGRYTTYQAISDALTKNKNMAAKGKPETSSAARASGCARAVGMAMRTNPFAPTVPCHRVLASDGKIGGFKGDWGTEGRFYNEKMRLLTEEGVRFDGNGKVIGEPFRSFV